MHFGLNTTFFQMEKQVERMQRDGVERVMLSLATPFIDYHLDAALAVEAAVVFNDGLAAAIAPDRTRFGGWALLPMQDPEAAAHELRRCVRDHRFIGGHIASNVRGLYLNDSQFTPIFQAAVDLGVPLFVHPADPLGKDRTREYELTIVAGYLFDSTINILKMICSGFLDRWPTLKLVCAHGGAFSPALRARMQREVDTNRFAQTNADQAGRRLSAAALCRFHLLRAGDVEVCDRGDPGRTDHAGERCAVSRSANRIR